MANKILWINETAIPRKLQLATSPELITTFRKGTKWLRPELLGTTVELVNCTEPHTVCTDQCKTFATATVTAIKACAFKDIDEIDHQRQSSDMTPERRLTIMEHVYGFYTPETITTVLTLAPKAVS